MSDSNSYTIQSRALLTRIAARMDMIDPNAPILSEINDFLDRSMPPSGPNEHLARVLRLQGGEIAVQQVAWDQASKDAARYRLARSHEFRLIDLRDEEELDARLSSPATGRKE